MWIKRSEYERLVSEAALAVHVPKLELRAEEAEAAIIAIRSEVMRAMDDAEALHQQQQSEASALVAAAQSKADERVRIAEEMLTVERRENRRAERHWASMFLRREKTYPLPPTKEEKAEAKAERVERASAPLTLNGDQVARRDAVRLWAKQNGFSEEDADKSFMSQLSLQVDE